MWADPVNVDPKSGDLKWWLCSYEWSEFDLKAIRVWYWITPDRIKGDCWFQKFASNLLDNQMETLLLSPIYTGAHFSLSMLIPLMPTHLKLPLISSYGVEVFSTVDFNKILCPCMCLLMGDQFPWQRRIPWAPSKSKAFSTKSICTTLCYKWSVSWLKCCWLTEAAQLWLWRCCWNKST